jgi:hypothetical protein
MTFRMGRDPEKPFGTRLKEGQIGAARALTPARESNRSRAKAGFGLT